MYRIKPSYRRGGGRGGHRRKMSVGVPFGTPTFRKLQRTCKEAEALKSFMPVRSRAIAGRASTALVVSPFAASPRSRT
jgi:hypothetical protein